MANRNLRVELARPADALRVALIMLARRGRLEIGDVCWRWTERGAFRAGRLQFMIVLVAANF
jgi:hypothetical protein